MQFGDEPRHLFLEGLTVALDFLGTDVAAGRQNVAVRGDFSGGGGFAEAGDLFVFRRIRIESGVTLVAAPSMIGGRDSVQVGVSELTMNAVDESAKLSGVDE